MLLEAGRTPTFDAVRELSGRTKPAPAPAIAKTTIDLSDYDTLITFVGASSAGPPEELLALLRGLNLGAMASAVENTALPAAKEGLSHEAFLLELARTEQAANSAGGSRACATKVCCRGRSSARSISIASLRPPGYKSSACATATCSPRPSMSSPLVDPAPEEPDIHSATGLMPSGKSIKVEWRRMP